jgi:hypothetical protein
MLLIRFNRPVYIFGLEIGTNYVERQNVAAYFCSGEGTTGAISYTYYSSCSCVWIAEGTKGTPETQDCRSVCSAHLINALDHRR